MRRKWAMTLAVGLVLGAAGARAETNAPAVFKTVAAVQPLAASLQQVFQAGTTGTTVSLYVASNNALVVRDLLSGACQAGLLTRPLKPREEFLARQKGKGIEQEIVARDALTFIVPVQSSVTNLSLPQLRGICRGIVTNWSEVGGADAPIRLFIQPQSAEMTELFYEQVSESAVDALSSTATEVADSAAVVRAVAGWPAALGYAASGTLNDKVRALSVDGAAPTPAAINARAYPFRRALIVAGPGATGGETLAGRLRTAATSAPGRAAIQKAGFTPAEPEP